MSVDSTNEALRRFLTTAGLLEAGEDITVSALTGGVSSEIWMVRLPRMTICVKRALPRLKVAAEWWAPISRNRVEREWLAFAKSVCPAQIPSILAWDDQAGLFAMDYLPPEQYPVWKATLLRGQVDAAVATEVGTMLGQLHAYSAVEPDARTVFATDDNFDALRLEPYFRVTARAHPDLAHRLLALADRTASARLAVVHGDVSPKNILLGPAGPVLLDAECAWFGDPAFDVAFCLNHLLLKSLAAPRRAPMFYEAARSFVAGHARGVDWEPRAALEARACSLLPALALARVDGASPVEYLSEPQRAQVRVLARPLLMAPSTDIDALLLRWADAV